MTTLRGIVAALVVASAVQTQPTAVAIRNVSVVDVTNGALRAEQTVLVESSRIRAVGSIRQVDIPAGATIVDGAGKFLVPGLWDMHVHTPSDAESRTVHLPLMIANGITGARVMWGRSFNLAQRAEIESGRLLGPRMVISTPIFDGRMWKGSIEATSPDEMRRMVRAFAAEGYDFVKTYQFLPRDIYLAIADEGRRLRIPVTGHVPMAVSLVESLEAGQRSIEHGVVSASPVRARSCGCALN